MNRVEGWGVTVFVIMERNDRNVTFISRLYNTYVAFCSLPIGRLARLRRCTYKRLGKCGGWASSNAAPLFSLHPAPTKFSKQTRVCGPFWCPWLSIQLDPFHGSNRPRGMAPTLDTVVRASHNATGARHPVPVRVESFRGTLSALFSRFPVAPLLCAR